MERLLAKASQKRFIAALLCVLMILSSVVAIPAVAEEGSAQGEPTNTPAPVAEEPSDPWTDETSYVRYKNASATNWTYIAETAKAGESLQNSLSKAPVAVQIRNGENGYYDTGDYAYNLSGLPSGSTVTFSGYDDNTTLKRTSAPSPANPLFRHTNTNIADTVTLQFVNLTIDGNDNTSSLWGAYTAFRVAGKSTMVLDNVTVQNLTTTGNATVIEAANAASTICVKGLTVTNCSFPAGKADVYAQGNGLITLDGPINKSTAGTFTKATVRTSSATCLTVTENFEGEVEHVAYSSYNGNGNSFAAASNGLNKNAKFVTSAGLVGYDKGDGKLYWGTPLDDTNKNTFDVWACNTSYIRYKSGINSGWTYVTTTGTSGIGTAAAELTSDSPNAATAANNIIEVRNNYAASGTTPAYHNVDYNIIDLGNTTKDASGSCFTLKGYNDGTKTPLILKRSTSTTNPIFRYKYDSVNKASYIVFEDITFDGNGLDKGAVLQLQRTDNTYNPTAVMKGVTIQNYGSTASTNAANNLISVAHNSVLEIDGITFQNCNVTANLISMGSSTATIRLLGACDFGVNESSTIAAISLNDESNLKVNAGFTGTVTIKNGPINVQDSFATLEGGTELNEGAEFINKAITDKEIDVSVLNSKLYWVEKSADPNAWADETAFVRYSLTDGASWAYAADGGTAGNGLTAAITAIGTNSGVIQIRNGDDGYYDAGDTAYTFRAVTGTITITGHDKENLTVIKRTATANEALFRDWTASAVERTIIFSDLIIDGSSSSEYFGEKTVFAITSGSDVSFDNVTIKNVISSNNGAVINTSGATTSIILNGVTIENCSTTSTAADSEKGVIYTHQGATITVAGTCNINGNVRVNTDEPVKIASDFVGTLYLCNGTTHGYGYAYVEGGVLPKGAILINAAYADCQHYVDGNIYKWFIPNDYSKKTVIDLEFTADPKLVLQGATVIKTESGKLQAVNGSGYIELLNKDESAFDVSGTGALSVVIDANGDTYSVYSGTSILYYMDASELVKAKGLTLPELNGKNVDTANTTSVSVYMIADSDVEKAGFQTTAAMAAGQDFDIRFVLAIDDIYMGNLSFNIAASLEGAAYGDGYNTPNVTTVYSSITDYNGDNYTGGNKGKYLVTIVVNGIQVSDLTNGGAVNFRIIPKVDNEAQAAIEYNLVYTSKTDSADATLVAAQ